MYKTVRHGENSLQYTILPQTEEVLSNSGLKGRGRDYSPSIHVRRSKKRSAIKYVILIVFGVIITLALASVPIYVMNGTVYANRMTIFVDRVPTTTQPVPTQKEIFMKSRKKELKISPELLSSLKPDIATTPPLTRPSEQPVGVVRGTLPPWAMLPAFKFWKASSTASSTQSAIKNEDATIRPIMKAQYKLDNKFAKTINDNGDLGHYLSKSEWDKVIIKPELTTGPQTTSDLIKQLIRSTSRSLVEDVLITTKQALTSKTTKSATALDNRTNKFKDLKEAILSMDDDEDFKESLEVDETKSLPPLKPADLPDLPSDLKIEVDGQDVIISKASDSSWFKSKWPFIDPSSYYQGTGFTSNDLLAVLVLGVTLVILIIFIHIIYTYNGRRSRNDGQTSVAAGRQADDNTNLLTAENAEEE